jgi:hypothetical protein
MRSRHIVAFAAALQMAYAFTFGPYDFEGYIRSNNNAPALSVRTEQSGQYRSQASLRDRVLESIEPHAADSGVAPTYVNYFMYTRTACAGGVQNQYSIAMDTCIFVQSKSDDGTYSSIKNNYSSTTNTIYTYYYTSADCTGSIAKPAFKFAPLGVAPKSCSQGGDDDSDTSFMYTISTGYSFPNANGYYEK